jgi:RND family efflux transporter MFP subunit
MNTKYMKNTISLVLTITLCGFFLAGCVTGKKKSSDKKKKDEVTDATGEKSLDVDKIKKPREYVVPVYARTLKRGPMETYLSTVGNLYPLEQVMISPELAGNIKFQKKWREGMRVKKGDVLAQTVNEEIIFGVSDAKLQLKTENNRLASAEAKLKKAQADRDYYEEKMKQGVVTTEEVENRRLAFIDAQSSLSAVNSSIASAQSSLAKAQMKHRKATIKAPFDGVLVNKEFLLTQRTSQNVEPLTTKDGQLIGAGEALFGLCDDSIMRVEVDVTGKDIARISPGQRAHVHVYAEDGIDRDGKVVDLSTSVDTTSRAFKVQVHLDNKDGKLSRGMFSRVDLVVDERRDTLSIPREVPLRRNNRLVVFVAGEEDMAQEREITTGIENSTHIEVVDGLQEGDVLIVRGAETLKDNSKVKVDLLDEIDDKEPDKKVSQRK